METALLARHFGRRRASAFFGAFSGKDKDWRQLRNIWEGSHIARAVFGMIALVAMGLALRA